MTTEKPTEQAAGGVGKSAFHPFLAADFPLALIAVAIVVLCFSIYLVRPYSVLSDTGYEAFSARQYVSGYAPVFNTVRLVDPRDLSKDVITPLTSWAPTWVALFVIAFKAGLSAGKAGRLIALLLSLAGAIGWVRMSSLLGLKGYWRIAGVVLAALYCLRTGTMAKTGAGDQLIYAVAPWLMAAAAPLAVPLTALRSRLVVQTTILSLLLGTVYWLKYSGIFFSLAVLGAVCLEQVRGQRRSQAGILAVLLVVYGTAFAIPVIGLKAYNYSISGTDFVETSSRRSPPRTATRLGGLLAETAFGVGTILFSAAPAAEEIVLVPPNTYPSVRAWILRLPGLALLCLFFWLLSRQPPGYIRNMALLSGAIPIMAFPALSFAAGLRFSYAIGRCCEPYWILFELLVFAFLSRAGELHTPVPRGARQLLLLLTASQVLLLLWIPFISVRTIWYLYHSPRYDSSAEDLWDTDLSKYGTREVDDRVKALIQSPRDVVVPANYSNRAFGTDTMIEFGGRLLPLSVFFVPLVATHGNNGANYNASTPFASSAPARIILVAPDPYSWPHFRESTQRIMRRFTQVRQWIPGPVDPHGRVWIWIGNTA